MAHFELTYDVGDQVELEAFFFDETTPVDPSSVTLTVTAPDESSAVYTTFTEPAAGQFVKAVLATVPGLWYYRWEASDLAIAAEEGFFHVTQSRYAA